MATVAPYKIKPCGHVKIELFIYFCPSYFNFLSLFALLFFCIKDLRLPFIILTLMLSNASSWYEVSCTVCHRQETACFVSLL